MTNVSRRRRSSKPSKGAEKSIPKAQPKKRARKVVKGKLKAAPKNKTKGQRKQKQRILKIAKSSVILGQFAHAAKKMCISPTTITIDGDVDQDVFQRVLIAIDEFLFRATLEKPSIFACADGNNNPVLTYQEVRGVYVASFLYYMWKCQCTDGDVAPPNTFSSIMLPVGLAKLFQQLAPYTDQLTGSTWKYTVSRWPLQINSSYGSIDSQTPFAPLDFKLGMPLFRYLIHPSRISATNTQLPDYATLGVKAIAPNNNTYVDFWTYFANTISTTGTKINAINTLSSSTIQVDQIPIMAPDASGYAFYTATGAFAPMPDFRSDIAIMIGRGYQSNGAIDLNNNFIYDKPLPTVRVYGTTAEQPIHDSSCQQTLLAVYAYVTSHCKKWTPNSALALAHTNPCYSKIVDFSYRSKAVSLAKFARMVFQCYSSTTWPQSGAALNNVTWTFIMAHWGACLHRLFMHSSVACTGNAATNPSFYQSPATVVSASLYPILSMIIGQLGPVVVNGRIVFPYLGVSGETINTPTVATNVGWTTAVASTGAMDFSKSVYGFGPSVNSVGAVTLTYPGTTTPLIRPTDAAYVWNALFTLNADRYYGTYKPTFPESMRPDTLATPPDNSCGVIAHMLSNVVHTYPPDTNLFTNAIVTATSTFASGALYSDVCLEYRDTQLAFMHSIMSDPDNGGIASRPLRVFPSSAVINLVTSLATNTNSAAGSQFFQFEQANLGERIRKQHPSVSSGEVKTRSAQIMEQSAAIEVTSNLIPPGTGSRDKATSTVTNLLSLAAKATLDGVKDGVGLVVNEWIGDSYNFTEDYVKAYIAKPIKDHLTSSVVKTIAGLGGLPNKPLLKDNYLRIEEVL